MIKITNTEVYGWESAIRGMRNPLNSWEKIDSMPCYARPFSKKCVECGAMGDADWCMGEKDYALARRLSRAGSDHAKYRRFITVTADINAPLYWWKEADTYKVGTVANSCSTMHKIQDTLFTTKDFSTEHLDGFGLTLLEHIIDHLNRNRELFLADENKRHWWQMIQLLPTSYNQLRTVQLNYEVLANMYHARKNHKLDEWKKFCKWIESLPYSDLITEKK